ncbi:hypothetical protein MBUL_01322 [Methylobacterium bullatum]|uniref:Uncharacterized protein n=1 Tax=Methylobacterium bullatum TaxID=570505 RepID=A0A679J6A0_9HYPH|nr:hypothetical protein MBUL_01322 [Methylobacterium bullatum]
MTYPSQGRISQDANREPHDGSGTTVGLDVRRISGALGGITMSAGGAGTTSNTSNGINVEGGALTGLASVLRASVPLWCRA